MKGYLPITVAGVDHHTPLDQRACFSFTKHEAHDALKRLKSRGVSAVLISTCNRTELWCEHADARAMMSECKGRGTSALFQISGWDAATHLFRVAVGLESALLGEDQILGQVKDALEVAQEMKESGPILNQLFRCAISAAKEVKRFVPLQALPVTAPARALEMAEESLGSLNGIEALVIGNGQMGRMAAEELLRRKANTRMTRRFKCNVYTHNSLPDVPGVTYIDYESRYEALDSAKLIISATASPHLTLDADLLPQLSQENRVFIDLAVPRDIDPRIVNGIPDCRLIDIDSISGGQAEGELPAMAIWDKHEKRFARWLQRSREEALSTLGALPPNPR